MFFYNFKYLNASGVNLRDANFMPAGSFKSANKKTILAD